MVKRYRRPAREVASMKAPLQKRKGNPVVTFQNLLKVLSLNESPHKTVGKYATESVTAAKIRPQ